MSEAVTTITATCRCKAFQLDVHFPTSSLPFDRALCLCTTCRKLSGTCGISYIPIPSSQAIDPSQYHFTSYSTSSDLTRYFCSTCGSHIFCNRIANATWHLATGLWDRTEGIINWTGCKWVEDADDGGVSVWFNKIVDADGKERKLKRWKLRDGDGELVPNDGVGSLREFVRLKARDGSEDRLKGSCHCGGVKYNITRPNEDSKTKAYSPFPDLMVPFHTGKSAANPDNKTWWLRHNDTKYMAGLCTCTSCRVASGFEIQPWAFVPKCNIFQEDGKELDYKMGTMKTYLSSEGVWRDFCGVCGANVFWRCAERPELLDVSAGLLDSMEGARVEGWLDWYVLRSLLTGILRLVRSSMKSLIFRYFRVQEAVLTVGFSRWTERVSFEELAVSRGLVKSLENGLKEWDEENKSLMD